MVSEEVMKISLEFVVVAVECELCGEAWSVKGMFVWERWWRRWVVVWESFGIWGNGCGEDGVEGSAMEFGDAAGVTVGLERWEVELGRRFKKQRLCVKEAHERDEMIVQNTRNLGVFWCRLLPLSWLDKTRYIDLSNYRFQYYIHPNNVGFSAQKKKNSNNVGNGKSIVV